MYVIIFTKEFVEKLLEKFGLSKAKVVRLPFACHFKLSLEQYSKTKDEKKWINQVSYVSIVVARYLL